MKELWRGVGLAFAAVVILAMLIPLICQFLSILLWPVVIFTFLAITARLAWFYTSR